MQIYKISTSFFTVIPQMKRTGVDLVDSSKSEPLSEEHQEKEGDEDEKHDLLERKKLCVEVPLENSSYMKIMHMRSVSISIFISVEH